MTIGFAIDWLSMTAKEDASDAFFPTFNFGFDPSTWTPAAPKHGYTVAFQHPFGMLVMMNPERPDMGTHMACSGRALKEIKRTGGDALGLVKWAVEAGISVSRIDLAIDVRDVEVDVARLFACEVAKPVNGRPRQQNIIQGKERGCTAYVGARTSDKFMRAYDKSAEMNLSKETLWTRFELELKGKAAAAAARKLAGMTRAQAMTFTQGLMRAHWDVQDEQYSKIMGSTGEYLVTEKNTEHDRLTWLMETCAKSLAKTMIELKHVNIWDAFKVQVETFYEEFGGVIDEQDKEA